MRSSPLAIFLIAVVAAILVHLLWPAGERSSAAQTSYDRMMQTQTLRCGYGLFPPFIVKDPNSGKLGGVVVDIMEEWGKIVGIKIDWTEEVDWGQIGAALQAKRIDAMCAGMWGTAARGKVVGFSQPIFYSTIDAYVRADDTRFDNNLARINQPDVRIATNDGDVTEEIALRDFPNAQRIAKVQMAGEAQLLLNVATNKADITFTQDNIVQDFNKTNPGVLRKVPFQHPLRTNQNVIGVDIKEGALLRVIDTGLTNLISDGSLDRILDRYEQQRPLLVKRVIRP